MYIFVFILILYKMPPRSSETVQWWEKRKKIVQRFGFKSYNAMCRAWNMYVPGVRVEQGFASWVTADTEKGPKKLLWGPLSFWKVFVKVTPVQPYFEHKNLFNESKMIKYLSPELVGTPRLTFKTNKQARYKHA